MTEEAEESGLLKAARELAWKDDVGEAANWGNAHGSSQSGNLCRAHPDCRQSFSSVTLAGVSAKTKWTKEAANWGGLKGHDVWLGHCYLSWLEILLNVVLRLVPRVPTATMMATDMPAAIRPYSIAVAPDRSFQNRTRSRDK
jgi:hypothetical protein